MLFNVKNFTSGGSSEIDVAYVNGKTDKSNPHVYTISPSKHYLLFAYRYVSTSSVLDGEYEVYNGVVTPLQSKLSSNDTVSVSNDGTTLTVTLTGSYQKISKLVSLD